MKKYVSNRRNKKKYSSPKLNKSAKKKGSSNFENDFKMLKIKCSENKPSPIKINLLI